MLRIYAVVGCLFAAVALVTGATPDPLYTSLRSVTAGDAFVVENLVLHRDAGTLTLKTGVIALTPQAMGRDTLAVFVGEGEFSLIPASGIEKSYLRSLTDQESFKDTFDRALFCFTDDTGKEIREQARTAASGAKTGDTLQDFRKKLRVREAPENMEAELLRDLYSPAQPGLFNAYLHGRKRKDLHFQVRPRGAVPDLGPEEVMLYAVQPEGVPDEILYLSHFQSEIGKGAASSEEDKRSVAAERYRIETTIARNDHFTASTLLTFKTLQPGERVIRLDLLPTLRVSRVSEGSEEIPFIQEDKKEDGAFYVVMPRPLEAGASHALLIEYEGDKVVHKAGGGNFSVGARESWYPNVNSFHDHARYELTFKVPKQYTLVSIGNLEKQWTEQDQACSHWISEVPLPVAGFNYGVFKKKQITDPESGIAVEGYATTEIPDYLRGSTGSTMAPSQLIDQTISSAQVSMRLFSAWFGKTEFRRIAITQQPEFNFGQSWPSLVYLPLSAYLDSTQRWQLMGIQNNLSQFVEEVTPHEVSHQWWGHTVGWATHHDQWLSEGFAEFSAGLFLQYTEKSPSKYLQYWEHARDRLIEKNKYGRSANDAGPVWLGARLSTEKNPGAYSAVVYRKGGYVLHMLRQMMAETQKDGDRAFIAMLQDFVEQHRNGNASTESFQRVVEKHIRPTMDLEGNGRMDWFFRQWVYGTAIPKYKFEYTLSGQADGKCLLKGSLTQSEVPDNFIMPVPVYLDFGGALIRMGSVRIRGNMTVPFEAMLPKKPKRAVVNAFHDVLEQK